MALLLRTFTKIDTISCTVLASNVLALNVPQGPTCPPLGCTPSLLANTSNNRGAQDAWGFIPPYTLHHHLLILDLAGGVIFGISSIMSH